MNTYQTGKLDLKGIGWFLIITYILVTLLALPMWLDGKGLNSPWSNLILLMNFIPAIATIIVARWISPLPHFRQATGLQRGAKGSRWGWYYLFGWFGFIGFAIAASFVAALLGLYQLDLAHFSAFHALLVAQPGGEQLLGLGPIQFVVLVGLLITLIYALVISPLNFGEELGWRGYLLPQLLPLGQWKALILSGVFWGLFHAPIVLLGYNYPQHPVVGVLLMTIMCVIIGILLGWVRLASGSLWPAVLGHAGIDASSGAILVFGQAGATLDSAIVGMTGWTGWILPVLVILALVIVHRLPVSPVAGYSQITPADKPVAPALKPESHQIAS
jgi:CAAX protease family protein